MYAELMKTHATGKLNKEQFAAAKREALRESAEKHPLIDRQHPSLPEAKFVMSLSSRELVVAQVSGNDILLQYKTAVSTRGFICFVEHTDARRSSDQKQVVIYANRLDAKKVTVDPVGRIRWAND
jgi:hypothetical protein